MKKPSPLKSSTLNRLSLGSFTLRTKLILGNILIILLAITGTGYYVYLRGQQANYYLTTQLDRTVRQQAQGELTSISAEQANVLNNFFESMRKNIVTVGATTENLLSQETVINYGVYWDATRSLTRLPNGSWDNSSADPASVFVPAKIDITDRLASELNTLRQLDFIVPTILSSNSDAIAIYFGGTSGETLYYPNIDLASIVPPDFDVTGRPWFIKAAPLQNPGRTAVWSDPYLDAALHGLVVTSSTPIYDSGGNFSGVVAMDIQLNRISDLVSNIHVGETGYAFLIDRDKRLVAMPDAGYKDFGITSDTIPLGELFDQSKIPISKGSPNFFNLLSVIAAGKTGLEAISFGGEERFVAYQPIPEVGYGLVIIVPSSEMLSESLVAKEQIAQVTRNTLSQSIFLVAGILAIALLATLGIGNGLTVPLRALTRTAQEITNGDLDAEIKVQSRDEIGTLAKTMNIMTSTLKESIQSLERRVAERTSALETASHNSERRAAQFEVVALITRAINSIRKTEELLPRITAQISEYFGYYHIGIFLNDESNQYAILSAANSEGGRRMLQRGHRLKIGEQGIVGHVAASGAIRIARNVDEDAIYFNNPDLPETSSEMALPLRIGTQIVGVLDVQSSQTDAFTEEDVKVLAILADQVSLAIDNTRLFETTRRSLAEAEALSRQYLHQAWSHQLSEQKLAGFRYSGTSAIPLETPLQLMAIPKAGHKREKATSPSLSVPIALRGETIGILAVQLPEDRSWSQEQIDLVNAVAERVALAVENARLFEETTRRADRERTVTEITTKIRDTTDPQTMLTTTIEELKKVLGTNEIQIRSYINQPDNPPDGASGIPKKKALKSAK
jgi:GAF domain-containing protein/HAMP domain-containing protein